MLNLSKQDDLEKFRMLNTYNTSLSEEDHDQIQIIKNCTLSNFVVTGEYVLEYNRFPVILDIDSNDLLIIQNGMIRSIGSGNKITQFLTSKTNPSAVILPFNKTKLTSLTKEFSLPLILNGDIDVIESGLTLVGEPTTEHFNFPTISFQCLVQLTELPNNQKSTITVAKWLHDGTLEILDYTPDISRKLNKEELKQLKKGTLITPVGMSFIGRSKSFHQSASVLIRDHRYKDTYYLIGQDEEVYFGCELLGCPKTIAEAYEDLIPQEAKGEGVQRQGEGVQRQGEWFMVPVKEDKIPDRKDCLLLFDATYRVYLPLDTRDSNEHFIVASEGRVSKEGVFAKAPELCHIDHASITGKEKNWYTFYKNTALRSVSIEGVD